MLKLPTSFFQFSVCISPWKYIKHNPLPLDKALMKMLLYSFSMQFDPSLLLIKSVLCNGCLQPLGHLQGCMIQLRIRLPTRMLVVRVFFLVVAVYKAPVALYLFLFFCLGDSKYQKFWSFFSPKLHAPYF